MTAASQAQTITERLVDQRDRSEADVQSDIKDLLLHGGLDLGGEHVRLESAVGRLQIDVEVGNTVIEVKKDLTSDAVRAKAKEQLAGYVQRRQEERGARYVGVLTDGGRWFAYHLPKTGDLIEASRFTLSSRTPDPDDLLLWLDGILATTSDIRPTPREIERRLGARSSATRLDLSELEWVYRDSGDSPSVQLKRELWARLLTTAFGTNFEDDTELFLEHTYLVVLAELIAHEVMGFDITSGALEADQLLSGYAFTEARIHGVVERDFFDWVTDSAAGRAWVHNLTRRVARFDWEQVDHDVLKVLYESVIGPETRHSLGEYYTPDWLARTVVERVVDEPDAQRVLDPGCGSGTFLFWAVRRCLDAVESHGASVKEAINDVTSRVFGLDIHPVAVTLARVTYLLAIGHERLTGGQRGGFTVPVWVGDSVQYHEKQGPLFHAEALVVHTTDGKEFFATELRFPDRTLSDVAAFDRLVADMTDAACNRERGSREPDVRWIYRNHGIHPDDYETLDATFSHLCRLHDEGRNHIWGYYVRNAARPRWMSQSTENRVDRLVGNPPWLAYRFMPDDMQDRFRQLSEGRNLWTGRNVATNQDLSALFAVRSVEQYLREGGKFGFVMPLAVLTRRAYEGFRTGKWFSPEMETGKVSKCQFGEPWDLHAVQPDIFRVPASVVFGTKTDTYSPMRGKVIRWSGSQPDRPDDLSSLDQHEAPLVKLPEEDDDWSPYRERFLQGATVVPRFMYAVERVDPGPLGVPEGQARVRSRRSNLEKSPWKELPSLEKQVPERFLYGLHLGYTVMPFRPLDPYEVILPWSGEQLVEGAARSRWPGLDEWFQQAERMWDENKSSGSQAMSLMDRLDYHNGLSQQGPALRNLRVVYSASGMNLAAALIDDPQSFIEHKLYWASVSTIREGRYLTGILNAPITTDEVAPLQSVGAIGRRDFDKYVWALPIPHFDPSDDLHNHIVNLVEEAEQVARDVDIGGERYPNNRTVVREALERQGVLGRLNRRVEELLISQTDGSSS